MAETSHDENTADSARAPDDRTVIGPVVTGLVSPQRDANIATNQTIIYTAEEHRRRLEDYVALLRRLAEGERARAMLAPEPPLSEGLPLDKLRLVMARSALSWEPPLPAPDEPLDELTRRSLVAGMLLPLLTTPLLVLTPGANWALGRLSSDWVAVLVQREGLAYIGRKVALDRDALAAAQLKLTRALADPKYAVGIARLLADLADGDGRDALAVALEEHLRAGGAQGSATPPVIQLLAAGALGGAASAGLLLTALHWLRNADVAGAAESSPGVVTPPDAPRTPASNAPWGIPVTIAEWRAELDRRNERFGEPAGYWCYVRPGTYRIGGWERGDEYADLELQAFWIARVPVTAAQYAVFIEAGGYREPRWWTPNGRKWLRGEKEPKPWRWREAPFNSRPRQAVVGVTWYEASAFCAWLGAQFALPRGYTLRLPSEAEWEAAAAYDASWRRRTYPWGEQEPTSQQVIFAQQWEDAAPDVATCPAGAAACGALDLAGTVWEPMAGSYGAYPRRAHWLKEDFTTGSLDVPYRGGCYANNRSYVRCGARYWFNPNYGSNGSGFRVLVAPQLAR